MSTLIDSKDKKKFFKLLIKKYGKKKAYNILNIDKVINIEK